MFIILEGLDNVGKTSQTEQIIKNFPDKPFHKLHYSSLPWGKNDSRKHISYSEMLYRDMFRMMVNLSGSRTNLILDRSHLGEAVYSPLYRNYSGDYVFPIEKEYSDFLRDSLFLIVLVNDPKTLHDREDGLSQSNNELDIQKEIDLFQSAFNKSSIKHKIFINIAGMGIAQVGKIIKEFIDSKSE